MSCHKELLAALQKQGMRLTAQRAMILEDLHHHPGHHTAEEIYRRVSEGLPGLNRATVYRTLDLLHGAHVVSAFEGADGVMHFELVPAGAAAHHHLHCRRCGCELALDAAPVERLRAEIRARYNFAAELDHMVIEGLCAECSALGG